MGARSSASEMLPGAVRLPGRCCRLPRVLRGKVKAGVDQHSHCLSGAVSLGPAVTFSSLPDWTPNTACVLERGLSLPVETL